MVADAASTQVGLPTLIGERRLAEAATRGHPLCFENRPDGSQGRFLCCATAPVAEVIR